jgi:hypothetical protein
MSVFSPERCAVGGVRGRTAAPPSRVRTESHAGGTMNTVQAAAQVAAGVSARTSRWANGMTVRVSHGKAYAGADERLQ